MRYLLKVFQFEPLNQNQPIEIDVQDIDHLGLIAGIVDEIGIVELRLPTAIPETIDQISSSLPWQ